VTRLDNALLTVRDVHYAVGAREIFSGLNLSAERGKITAIMGPSGTGKTTLLRLLTGQIVPTAGEIRVFGENPATLGRRPLFALRRRMGMLFQNGALLTDLSVFENVAFPLREHAKLSEAQLKERVLGKLQAVGLREASRLMPAELSGGMARRVALARAMANEPELLIYDEPFVGLDPISMGVILRLIQETNAHTGITSLIVSHDVEQLEKIADYSYLLSSGKAVAEGTPEQMKRSSEDTVRQFIGGLADGPVPFHYTESGK
jgi:phospholipid/cholesterol/gamma-HCH transport system ATP-binding protein